MEIKAFDEALGAEFYTGVPDSQLKEFCNYLMARYGISDRHIIAANEGNCTALAAGYHLATGKVPVVYLQNSGIGNLVNPVASLLNEKVYAVPCIFVVGWRGEPGVPDEPQHLFQGEITLRLLEDLGISAFVVTKETTEEELQAQMREFRAVLRTGNSVAFVIKKGAFTSDEKISYRNDYTLSREEVIRCVAEAAGEDLVVSTTGKASRELFEIREAAGQSHQYDFLTVGSMGHSSSIALGVALNKPQTRVWCIDGDGAALMHMGALAVIGTRRPENLVHVLINNAAHETVGGLPTVAGQADLAGVARACGYPYAVTVQTQERLDEELRRAKTGRELTFLEVKCSLGAREDLGRPTIAAVNNKENFMRYTAGL